MSRLFRALASILRLACGALRLPSALLRGRNINEFRFISVDVFGTLLARSGDEDAVWREGASRAVGLAKKQGIVISRDPSALRRAAERKLSDRLRATGEDPEFSHRASLEEMLRSLGAGESAGIIADEVASWELDAEIASTRSVPATVSRMHAWRKAGARVVAVSDTRYTAHELSSLLERQGISGLSAIYASADQQASKFSGRLFDRVAEVEGIQLRSALHVGDNLLTDVLSAAQRGLAVKPVSHSGSRSVSVEPQIAPSAADDSAVAFGYSTLGPILVAFTRLLFHQAHRDRVRRLVFVARDGYLPLQVAQILAERNRLPFVLDYLQLSRRALACCSPELRSLEQDSSAAQRVISMLQNLREMGTAMDAFQQYYGVPSTFVSRHWQRLELSAGDANDVACLLTDCRARADLTTELAPAQARVRKYLIQQAVLSEETALVDIGWRGSLQKIIQSEAKDGGLPSPRGYYFGLWSEQTNEFPADAHGLICDQRRGRNWREASAWQAAFLLEALCRGNHGSVTGLAEQPSGNIGPLHLETGKVRNAERASESLQQRVWDGVLAYARTNADISQTIPDEREIRRNAQRRLFRLAFFPTESECRIGCGLVHSEPTQDEAPLRLLYEPVPGLGGWLSGLRSPWKGGYIRSTAGTFAAVIHCGLELLLSRMPAGVKPRIRHLLLRSGPIQLRRPHESVTEAQLSR